MKKRFVLALVALGMLACTTQNKPEEPNQDQQKGQTEQHEQNDPYVSNGLFSVGENTKVQFSQGYLQYQASTGTWRFAEHQYDFIGYANENISATYDGWIDLFGWGTGNNPTNSSTDAWDYPMNFVDWGNNPISNGGNISYQWRTLSGEECDYLLRHRANADSLLGGGCIEGVNGLILLPDDWRLPNGMTFIAQNRYEISYATNTYTLSQWGIMESAGAVFLPAAGFREGTSVYRVGSQGGYWMSTYYHEYETHYTPDFLWFNNNLVYVTNGGQSYSGNSVRLVK